MQYYKIIIKSQIYQSFTIHKINMIFSLVWRPAQENSLEWNGKMVQTLASHHKMYM